MGGDDADTPKMAPRGPLFPEGDPTWRMVAQLGPALAAPAPPPPAPGAAQACVSMEQLVPELVRRIAWSCSPDGRRGTVRLELGAGPHAGTTVTVHSEGGRVRVVVEGARNGGPAADADDLRDRIDRRLRARGLDVDCVT